MNFRSITLMVAGLYLAAIGLADRAIAAEPDDKSTRIVVGLGSADQVLQSLEFCVVKLAGKAKSWTDNIQPNLEIFLYGVSTDQPIRFDMLLDAEHGSQMQSIIPIADLKEFLVDNLDPIGIESKAVRGDKNLYELTGTVYEGFLRYLPKPVPYAVIFPQKEALPAEMPNPSLLHAPQVEEQSLLFLALKNQAENLVSRQAAFDKFFADSLEKFQKLSTETKEQFAFRKRMREQSLSVIGQWIVQSASGDFGVKVNEDTQDAPSKLTLSALPGTDLEKDLTAVTERVSRFAAVAAPEKSVLSARLNLPVDPGRKAAYQEIYKLAEPVFHQRIDDDTKASAEEKAARKELASLLTSLLTECMDKVPAVDAFLDIVPVKDKHAITLGVVSTNQAKMNQILEKLSAAKTGWKLELNVEKVGDTSIHKLSFGSKPPQSLTDFYGDANFVCFATSEETFWLSGGDGAMERLKTLISQVSKTSDAKPNGVLLSLDAHVQPLLKNVHAFMNDPELAMFKQVNLKTRNQRAAQEEEAAGKKPEKNSDRAGNRAANLASFEWQETAIAALEGLDDHLTAELKVDSDKVLHGASNAQAGILKALGAVVAKFSDENLQ